MAVDCKLDAGSYAACDSGTTQSYAGPLAEGSHTFTVRVTDAATNSSTDSYTWVVDTTAPTVSITGNPADPTNDTSASFTFTTGGSPVAVDCKLDAGSYAACDSGTTQSYAGPLAGGSHTFTVRVTDAATNSSTDSYTWVVDTMAPTVSITGNPADPTNDTSASFTFTTGGSPVAVDCKLDAGSYAACDSGTTQSYAGPLAEGSHTFTVRVTDAATNSSTDSYTWTVDTAPPDTTITAKPSDPDNDTNPAFSFTGNDGSGSGVASFECQMDSGGFSTCTSGSTFGPLADGSHTFEVRAVDVLGSVDPTPASYIWTINTMAPTVSITGNPADPTNDTSASFTFTTGGSPVAVDCKLDAGSYAACDSGTTQSYAGPLAGGIAYLHGAGN